MAAKQRILIIGFVWPEPNSSAAGSRMMQLIELFKSQEWEITFASAAADSDYMINFENSDINKINIQLNNSSFDEFIKQLQPTIVLFDRFLTEEQFGWRVAENCPNSLRILDTEDLHCLRDARKKAVYQNKLFSNNDLFSDIAKREIASILRCDISLIVSSYEMDLLQHFFKVDTRLLHYIPFMFEPLTVKEINSYPTFEERKHFISIGNFLHEPNTDAIEFLKNEIWSLIRKQLPTAEMHVYGAYPSQKIMELNNPEQGFIIKGRVENAQQVTKNARVCLAPLRFGAGIKGKLTEAMICGTPSVTTNIGAEAMHNNLPWSGIIANTIQEIATTAVKLYSGKTEWLQAQQRGIEIINTCYSKEIFGKQLIEKINSIADNIQQHRLNNFIGSMLMYHGMQSTKYMSKWIEEKNKVKN